MMNANALQYWLRRKPLPTSIRICDGDKVSEYVKDAHQNWGDVARSILAMDPDKIEVYDQGGKLVRATRFDDDDVVETPTAETKAKGASIETQIHIAIEKTLGSFAQHLADAYRFSNEQAFNTLCQIANSRAVEVVALQKAVQSQNQMILSLQQQRVEDAFEQAEQEKENADPLTSLASTFMKAREQGAADATTRKTNGARANGKGQI